MHREQVTLFLFHCSSGEEVGVWAFDFERPKQNTKLKVRTTGKAEGRLLESV